MVSAAAVLILDDSCCNSLRVWAALSRRGITVDVVESTSQAILRLQQYPDKYSLILVSSKLTLRHIDVTADEISRVGKFNLVLFGPKPEDCRPEKWARITEDFCSTSSVEELLAEFCHIEEDPGASQRCSEVSVQHLRGLQALVFDQDTSSIWAVQQALDVAGIESCSANGIQECLAAMARELPDFILVSGSGLAAAQCVAQAKSESPALPCIGVGLDPGAECSTSGLLEAGADAVIEHPVELHKLLFYIHQLAGRGEGAFDERELEMPEPQVDMEHLLDTYDGDWEFLLELLDAFVGEGLEKMQSLTRAVLAEDISKIRFDSHALKGSSRSAGIPRLGDVYAGIEARAKELLNRADGQAGAGPSSGLLLQHIRLLTSVATQGFREVVKLQKGIEDMNSIKVEDALDWVDGRFGRLVDLLKASLGDLWLPVKGRDVASTSARMFEEHKLLEVATPDLWDVASEVIEQGPSSELGEVLEGELENLRDDLALLIGWRNLPKCCRD